MAIETRPLSPSFATEIVGIDLSRADRAMPRSMRSGPRSIATPSWSSATSASATRSCATSRPASARWRSAALPLAQDGGAWRFRRSATSPTSTWTTMSARSTTGAGSTASATGCGTPTRRTCRCPSCSGCCTPLRCRRPHRSATARPNSPICAPPTMRCPTARKQAIDDLVVEHDIFWSRGQIGFTEFPPGEREQYPPSPQRLVRLHPGSKRKTLYLSAHASHIVGWPVADGRLLLWDLTAHATQRAVRLQPHLAGRRSGDLGQPLHDASRPPARRVAAARSAPCHHIGHLLDA